MTTNQDLDLKTVEGVKSLMTTSKNEKEWNENCDKVKAANLFNDYPHFWYAEIILSGLLGRVKSQW